MNFLGIGGLEFLLLAAVALFVLGPKRMLEGIREARKVYSNLRRQRAELQSMITEAIDLEDIKQQIDSEGLLADAKGLKEELALDQVAEDVKNAADINESSVPRSRQLNRSAVKSDDATRAAIPDLGLPDPPGENAESSSVKPPKVPEVTKVEEAES